MNAWFRMYSEFSDDPKVQMMSEALQRRLVMLFCSKCKGETLHETELAFHWRISEAELAETKSTFMAKGFIDEHWNLENWNKRQFISDSSTDRVRKYRQARKQNETLHLEPETPGDVTVTPPDTEQIQNRTEQKQPQQRIKRVEPSIVLPDWLDREAWFGYLEMRKKQRKPATDHSQALLVKKLESMRRAGNNPNAVLNQSTMNGWQGLFEVHPGAMPEERPRRIYANGQGDAA